ncbi:MAG: hypothetical protein HRU25_12115 [Psychrobium sp.]|nr:hypothetical protein [Psychrobium sp.]
MDSINMEMNPLKVSLMLIFSTLVVGCQSTENIKTRPKALKTDVSIELFMRTCVVGRESTAALTQSAYRIGFKKAPAQLANIYLNGHVGQAWFLSHASGEFGLMLLENNLCSLFIHQGDPDTIQTGMESWLPQKDSGFSYQKSLVSSIKQKTTTSYTLHHKNRALERWVITVNREPVTNLVAVMSYYGERYNKQ